MKLELNKDELITIYNRLNAPNRIFAEKWCEEGLTPNDYRVRDRLFEKVENKLNEVLGDSDKSRKKNKNG